MTNSNHEDIIRKTMVSFWSEGKRELASEIYHPEYVRNDPWAPGVKGREGLLKLYDSYRAAIPDLTLPIDFMFGEGDRVALQYWMWGTQTGKLLDIPPTGNQFHISCTAIFKIRDSMIIEDWHNYDMFGLMQSLGVVPNLEDLVEELLD